MKIWRLPSAFRTRRLISAIRSFEPGRGLSLQNFPHSSSDARSAKADDGITNSPRVIDTIRPSKIEIKHAVGPTSRRNVVVRYRPRRTNPSSSLTRCFSVSIIPAPPLPFQPAALRRSRPLRSIPLRSMMGVDRRRGQSPDLEPGAYQRDVGRAGCQQGYGERELDTLAGGLEDRSHG